MSWFRYHLDALDNPKVQDLSAVLFKFWVNLLCVASISSGFLPETSEISFRCRCTTTQAKKWLADLIERKLIDQTPTGQLVMHDWSEHQFSSDNSTGRVRRFREKRKGNVSETPPEQNRTEQNRTEHTPVPFQRAPIAADLSGQTSQRFEEFWQQWPRKQHRDQAARMWLSVVTVEQEAAVFACLGRFLRSEQVSRAIVPNPENWLTDQHRDRWQGDWPKCPTNGKAHIPAPAPEYFDLQKAKQKDREERERRERNKPAV